MLYVLHPLFEESLYSLSLSLWLYAGLWPLFQVLNPIHSLYDPLDVGIARRKAATYT
jgi:hypothetical protein